MSSDGNHSRSGETNGTVQSNGSTASKETPGLPPVKPPSARFIVQLFLVPLLIVGVIVVILGGIGYVLVAERRDPDYFLNNLDSTNSDIRWRTAHDLAQVLKKPESLHLASDPKFALGLAERLHRQWELLKTEEGAVAKRIAGMSSETAKRAEWNKLQGQRNHVLFMISALGDFTVPVGAPILCDLAVYDNSPDIIAETIRRRRAVWALANLGANLKRYKELSKEKQQHAIAVLKKEKKGSTERAKWADKSYLFLTENRAMQVDASMEICSKAEDSILRTLVAHALNFWDGPRTEATLIRLSSDDGHGTRLLATEEDRK